MIMGGSVKTHQVIFGCGSVCATLSGAYSGIWQVAAVPWHGEVTMTTSTGQQAIDAGKV